MHLSSRDMLDIEKFLKDFNFDTMEWDGSEIIIFYKTEPFGIYEFVSGTPTRENLEMFTERFQNHDPFSYIATQK